jgi:hypothetical protein
MISRIFVSYSKKDEMLAKELSLAIWRVGLESYVTSMNTYQGVSRSDRISFCIRNSECLVALITKEGSISSTVAQEIGFAKGIDLLIIPILEENVRLPTLIEHSDPITFSKHQFIDAIGMLIKTIRDLTRLDWLKVICPKCGEEMTQYLTPQDDVDEAVNNGSKLETICSYCQNKISLDPRTFAPISQLFQDETDKSNCD